MFSRISCVIIKLIIGVNQVFCMFYYLEVLGLQLWKMEQGTIAVLSETSDGSQFLSMTTSRRSLSPRKYQSPKRGLLAEYSSLYNVIPFCLSNAC